MTDDPSTNPDPRPAPKPSPPAPAPHAPAEASKDTPTGHHINADRPCARCGFNLFGQPLVREAHYGLIAVRCSECGQVAALQEYPALGRWADRWARTLAALWIVVLFAAAGLQFGPTFGMLLAGTEIASENLGQAIALAYDAHTRTNTGAAATAPQYSVGGWLLVEIDWWREHGDALIGSNGGLAALINRRYTWLLTPLNLVSFAAGIFWSVCLLGARRHRVVVPALLPPMVALIMAWLAHTDPLTGNATMVPAREIATGATKRIVLPLLAGTATLSLLLGVWQGRRIARTVVRLSLPPRMRSSLAILWTRDGLPSPATGMV